MGADGSGKAALSAAGAGLVYSETTRTHVMPRTLGPFSKGDQRKRRLLRMRKNTLNAARLFKVRNGFRYKWAMLTLTYRPGAEWFASNVRDLLQNIRVYMARRKLKLECVWVMELTKAGVPHYHVLIRLPKGTSLPMPDKRGWWTHGSTRIEWAKNAIGYIAKYASKGDETSEFPKGARINGCGGLTKDERIDKSWWTLPLYVRDHFASVARIARVKGGFAHTDTGEFLASPYTVTISGGVILITLKEQS